MFVNLVTRECGLTSSDKYIAEVAKVLHGHQSHSSDDARFLSTNVLQLHSEGRVPFWMASDLRELKGLYS
jgi:hypothetical protein